MEVLVRCRIPDRPGMLATLAGAIGDAGGDIQAVEVVESSKGAAIDDLWVVTEDMGGLVARIEEVPDVKVVHAGLSRGVPGDGTARLAAGIDALMSGAMRPEDGLPTLLGGLLQASSAELQSHHDWPEQKDRRVLRLNVAGGVLVLTREYKFLDAEIQRVHQIIAVCERAAAVGAER